LARPLDIGAVGDAEIVQVGNELAAIGIGAALLERRYPGRVGIYVVHSAECIEQRARLVDHHRVHVKPGAIAGRRCEVVGRIRGHGADAQDCDGADAQTDPVAHGWCSGWWRTSSLVTDLSVEHASTGTMAARSSKPASHRLPSVLVD